jgi:AbrB family looped-hinge helix DNA binding protein
LQEKGLAFHVSNNSITSMKTLVSKITSKGQATIPVEVRRRLKVGIGEHVAFRVDGDRVELARARPMDLEFAESIAPTLASEWMTREDEAAYGDL